MNNRRFYFGNGKLELLLINCFYEVIFVSFISERTWVRYEKYSASFREFNGSGEESESSLRTLLQQRLESENLVVLEGSVNLKSDSVIWLFQLCVFETRPTFKIPKTRPILFLCI